MPTQDDRTICLLGPATVKNEAAAYFLKREVGLGCKIMRREEFLVTLAGKKKRVSSLLLVDFEEFLDEDTVALLEAFRRSPNGSCPVVVVNAPETSLIEKRIAALGVQGIFRNSVSPATFAEGIRMVLDGETYVASPSARRRAERQGAAADLPGNGNGHLSLREIEILNALCTGATNKHIAGQLKISNHTVRTHIHNIFQKINVTNRIQALQWFSKSPSDVLGHHANGLSQAG